MIALNRDTGLPDDCRVGKQASLTSFAGYGLWRDKTVHANNKRVCRPEGARATIRFVKISG